MNTEITLTENGESLDSVLEKAQPGVEVIVNRADGSMYSVRLIRKRGTSPLDLLGIPKVDLGLTTEEIVQIVREGRERLWDADLKRFVWPDEEKYALLAKDIDDHPASK